MYLNFLDQPLPIPERSSLRAGQGIEAKGPETLSDRPLAQSFRLYEVVFKIFVVSVIEIVDGIELDFISQ